MDDKESSASACLGGLRDIDELGATGKKGKDDEDDDDNYDDDEEF